VTAGALMVADRVYIMERGKIVMTGTAQEAQANIEQIESAYLSHVD
jgi:ABC-type branched-subunit amino acid transport system ATPase component